jgi:hypothetical protein
MATKRAPIYQQVVDIVADYLGPAASRFIDRHIQNHLHKPSDKLEMSDLPVLIDWIRISMAFLTEDRTMIDELTHRLTRLHGKQAKR